MTSSGDDLGGRPEPAALIWRLVREDDGLELLEWAVVALVLSALAGAYVTLRNQTAGAIQSAVGSFPGGN